MKIFVSLAVICLMALAMAQEEDVDELTVREARYARGKSQWLSVRPELPGIILSGCP